MSLSTDELEHRVVVHGLLGSQLRLGGEQRGHQQHSRQKGICAYRFSLREGTAFCGLLVKHNYSWIVLLIHGGCQRNREIGISLHEDSRPA